MIPEWETNRLFVSDRLEAEEPALFAGIEAIFGGTPFDVLAGTHEIWCRDFMPVQIGEDTFCQFQYRPDYLEGFEWYITPPEKCRLPFMKDYRRESIVLEGGNLVAARGRVILTDKVFASNPGIERPRLRERLEGLFGVECLFIPTEPDDVLGHADGVVRFVSEDRVLINDDGGSEYERTLRCLLERSGIQVETMPMFLDEDEGTTPEIPSAVGIYLNYLRVGNIVVLPTYDRPEDRLARDELRRLMPDVEIFQLPCTSLAKKGGVLNCVSWTVKDGARLPRAEATGTRG